MNATTKGTGRLTSLKRLERLKKKVKLRARKIEWQAQLPLAGVGRTAALTPTRCLNRKMVAVKQNQKNRGLVAEAKIATKDLIAKR